ncbi:Rho GDI domain containing protein [Asbolus verrucosus]|uniref:Rho GDI domain containing protein n=1 Tax=Asbolus verrucosus TaxID=1661398 RepID=A0A482V8M1_ASBVE|nr:Rho GDI domain containing protein [Asbolus verrucosus]
MFKGDITSLKIFKDESETSTKRPLELAIEEIPQTTQDDKFDYHETFKEQVPIGPILVEPNNPHTVIVKRIVLLIPDRPEYFLDIPEDLSQLKKNPFLIKEGARYRMRIEFYVQREAVRELTYTQRMYRFGRRVDKMCHILGSYAPKQEMQFYLTFPDYAPVGILLRGNYRVQSLFTDGQCKELFKWEWILNVRKDWKDQFI